MADLPGLFGDLRAEGDALDALVTDLSDDDWRRDTPAAGWTVAHQIGHLLWTDRAALTAVTDATTFVAETAKITDATTFVDEGAGEYAALPPRDLLAEWRHCRESLGRALADVPAGEKIPWYGPPMSAASMATARLMETWAHGRDVAAALGTAPRPTTRLRHVAHIGVRTRDFAFVLRDRAVPAEPFRVELAAPDGSTWTWGPDDAAQSVTGPALDFCLLVTQRVHRSDTALVARGPDADAWLDIAQAFAGPPGSGREQSGKAQ
ncbi:TIGR03084 family protein [Rhodococcus sp. HNM0563]|uniref:TIGR03084 family metal-binding protein n=1 Tax=unclassified Rhodococcus (in: high G+C Gram-positive bacteria) TaxID=192944 RepID=UPI00146CE7B3|nr:MULTISPECIES: TIGR03084 family metal-binding protein [unclassified Rhodococcus (in: high G+C Gram-positive bacteria)]MCK0090030.1 TIGR03084 family metal-binding protein [Rhodococcus sp. F64268]NLU64556.1 TIGR03084 family protein [Rhodococcus sp. HNM0563]